MKLIKNNFYVFSMNQNDVVYYHVGEDIETDIECRLCTELEKEYWFDSMGIVDEEIPNNGFGAVSLCDFEDWKKEKGYEN